MYCRNCGKEISDGNTFCTACGHNNGANNANAQASQPQQVSQPQQPHQPVVPASHTAPPEKGKSKNGVFIIVLILVLVAVLSVGGWLVYNAFFAPGAESESSYSSQTTEVDESDDEDTDESDEEGPARPDVENAVNNLITAQNLTSDVAVAVIDNKTGEQYLCNGASEKYTSWGFYLPVYMTFCDNFPDSYASYKSDILSSNVSKCNSAANYAIDLCGGPAGVTSHLSSKGFNITSCGRKYGDLNAASDNYTCASEAAAILQNFNSQYNYSDLCYNPATFGIAVPAGASMYAQFGTENLSEKNNLNVFAVIKGETSDYSLVVLSKNKAYSTGIVNAVINTVHNYMEGNM